MEKDFDIEIKKYLTNGAKLNENYNLKDVPDVHGIYIVECPDGVVPEFMDTTISKKIIKTGKKIRTAEELQIKYDNGNKKILYIGKAEGEEGLNQRIERLKAQGYGNGNGHRGGKALWQIKNIRDMNLYWCPVENARETERELLMLHLNKYPFFNERNKIKKGFSYPVANWEN